MPTPVTSGTVTVIRTDTNAVVCQNLPLDSNGNFTSTNANITSVANAGIPLQAQYAGSPGFNPSNSNTVTEPVQDESVDTVTTLSVSPDPAVVGGQVTFSGNVSTAI